MLPVLIVLKILQEILLFTCSHDKYSPVRLVSQKLRSEKQNNFVFAVDCFKLLFYCALIQCPICEDPCKSTWLYNVTPDLYHATVMQHTSCQTNCLAQMAFKLSSVINLVVRQPNKDTNATYYFRDSTNVGYFVLFLQCPQPYSQYKM